jgi:hypothetical protein
MLIYLYFRKIYLQNHSMEFDEIFSKGYILKVVELGTYDYKMKLTLHKVQIKFY